MISYKYKLYRTKKVHHLDNIRVEACCVWNHALSLQKRYYNLYGKYISSIAMQKHFTKRYKRTYLHSQTLQEILQRLDKAYQRFFNHKSKRPPKYKKSKYFSSFVYKQGGFSINGNIFHVNSVKKDYRFWLSRPWRGNVKQVRLKCTLKGEWFLYIITDAVAEPISKTHDGASVGIDYGLKTYLTLSDGTKIANPQFLKSSLKKIRKIARNHSLKKLGSNNKEKSRKNLVSLYERISNKREDFQWKLAHELCRKYDHIFIEDLSFKGMVKVWGRKVCDLAHSHFIDILFQVASKYGCTVYKISKWFPSSKLCECGYKNNNLSLSDRSWICPQCGQIHERDVHAAEMILRRGIYELGSDSKTIEPLGFEAVTLATQESHVL